MAREWEVEEQKKFDTNDFWYQRYDLRQEERQARRFRPEDYKEYDLRNGSARRYKYNDMKYLRDDFRQRNSYKGMWN